jgi:type II secretory ATPase GspE/PulE/Tfp pilus assembly ATPase PilB-like protein
MADPLDIFARDAIAAAIHRPVSVAVAVPIELEAALERLYAELSDGSDAAEMLDEMVADAEPAEEDAERLKDLASEAPVIRLVNQLIARAVETHASDVHLEPFPDRLRIRYRYDGVLHEVESPPARLHAATRLIFGFRRSPRCTARRSSCASSTEPLSSSTTQSSACPPTFGRGSNARSSCRTAWC